MSWFASFLLRLVPGEQVQDLLLAARDCGKCLHNSASCLSCSLGGRCEKNLQKVELKLAFFKKLHLPVCELTNKANNIFLICYFLIITCRSQLLWLSLSRRGKRPSPFLDLMNCFHFHTYFSSRYCFRNSAFPWGFDIVSWPAIDNNEKFIECSYFIKYNKWINLWHSDNVNRSDTILTSCWKTLFPGLIRCFGIFFEPELGLGVDFITVGPDCSQRLNGSIL